jgi:GNAT superfamily N-acetyltransferase
LNDAAPDEIEIRRVGPDDNGRFDRVGEDVFDDAIHRGRLAAYLSEPGHHMVVAVSDGEVVGQVAAVVHRHPDKPTELYLDEVGVTPAPQRRGVARRMLDAMFAWGRELGCKEAWVGTGTG